nr:D-hexose-6-phosphate mutarotase [Vibrio aestuarianus]
MIKHENYDACISLFGGQLLGYRPSNEKDVIWLGEKAVFDKSKPIRGGVPLCFPWFGNAGGSQTHGFARNVDWKFESCKVSAESVEVILSHSSDEETKKLWKHDFENKLRFNFGKELTISLITTNTSDEPWSYSGAIHTYFSVGNIRKTSISGVGEKYLDGVVGYVEKQGGNDIEISEETIRICLDSKTPIVIKDRELDRTVEIENHGNTAAVVWNPWIETTKATADMIDREYEDMLCVESTIYGDYPIELKKGEFHELSTVIRLK